MTITKQLKISEVEDRAACPNGCGPLDAPRAMSPDPTIWSCCVRCGYCVDVMTTTRQPNFAGREARAPRIGLDGGDGIC